MRANYSKRVHGEIATGIPYYSKTRRNIIEFFDLERFINESVYGKKVRKINRNKRKQKMKKLRKHLQITENTEIKFGFVK